MTAAGARSEARAASLVAWTCLFVLCDSGSAVFAACAIDTPTQLLAIAPPPCSVSVSGKSYDGDGENIAVRASGAGATITWTGVGLSKILTSGDGLPAVQADEGGSIEITGGSIGTSGTTAPAILSKGGGSSVMLNGEPDPDRWRWIGGTGGERFRRVAERHSGPSVDRRRLQN